MGIQEKGRLVRAPDGYVRLSPPSCGKNRFCGVDPTVSPTHGDNEWRALPSIQVVPRNFCVLFFRAFSFL